MRLPELLCWSIPPLDNPTRELQETERGWEKILKKEKMLSDKQKELQGQNCCQRTNVVRLKVSIKKDINYMIKKKQKKGERSVNV